MFTRLLVPCAVAALLPAAISAQPPARPSRIDTATPRMCDMRYKMLMLTVMDAKGAPVPGVTVALSGIGATPEGREPRITSETGEAQLAEDVDMRFLAPGGSRVTVTLRKGRKVKRVAMTLGKDAAGCHIDLLAGERTVRF